MPFLPTGLLPSLTSAASLLAHRPQAKPSPSYRAHMRCVFARNLLIATGYLDRPVRFQATASRHYSASVTVLFSPYSLCKYAYRFDCGIRKKYGRYHCFMFDVVTSLLHTRAPVEVFLLAATFSPSLNTSVTFRSSDTHSFAVIASHHNLVVFVLIP